MRASEQAAWTLWLEEAGRQAKTRETHRHIRQSLEIGEGRSQGHAREWWATRVWACACGWASGKEKATATGVLRRQRGQRKEGREKKRAHLHRDDDKDGRSLFVATR